RLLIGACSCRRTGTHFAGTCAKFSSGSTPMDQDNVVAFPQAAVLEPTEASQVGLRKDALDRLARIIEGHVAENRYPGAQVAVARHGKLALYRSFGAARLEPRAVAGPDTLWLLYSNTKVVTACAVW